MTSATAARSGRHVHRSIEAHRRILHHVAGDVYLVLAICQCRATRRELIRYLDGRAHQGELVEAGSWEAGT